MTESPDGAEGSENGGEQISISIDGPVNTESHFDDPEQYLLYQGQTVINHQVEFINDIDDKALRTVRLSILFLGLVVGGLGFSGGEIGSLRSNPILNNFTKLGILSIVGSIMFGVYTYSLSNPIFGIDNDEVIDVRDRYHGDIGEAWDVYMVDKLADWIDKNEEINEQDGTLLFLTQLILVVGIAMLLIGSASAIEGNAQILWQSTMILGKTALIQAGVSTTSIFGLHFSTLGEQIPQLIYTTGVLTG